ncbi:MAG: protein kinase [Propionibacteriaceae bacterium]|jgi:tRNA A-37 threonylcarbamoyl transferase component Bud32|nr:protein kinase [Propionibacteriaceae bacterium]
MAEIQDPNIGRVIDGRYQILARVDAGGMATVYQARDVRIGREVALKMMHGHLAVDEDFVKRFQAEARSVAQLSHPNIVQVFDTGMDSGQLYIVMEYVPGGSLRGALNADGPVKLGQALEIARQVLSALALAHSKGIIHRDIKPENLLLAADGAVKVADFGIARAINESRVTATGVVVGTVGYMAPELVMQGKVSQSIDVYAVGVMLYELVSSRFPFTGENAVQVALQQTSQPVPQLRQLLPWVPAEVDGLLANMLAADPSYRFPNAIVALPQEQAVAAALPAAALERKASPRELPQAPYVAAASQPRQAAGLAEPEFAQAAPQTVGDKGHATWKALLGAAATIIVGVAGWAASNWEWISSTIFAPSPAASTGAGNEPPSGLPSDFTADLPTGAAEDQVQAGEQADAVADAAEAQESQAPAADDPLVVGDGFFTDDSADYRWDGTVLRVEDTSPRLVFTAGKQLPTVVELTGGIPYFDFTQYPFTADTKITFTWRASGGQPKIFVPPTQNVKIKWTDMQGQLLLNDGLDDGKRVALTETSGSRAVTHEKGGPVLTIVLDEPEGIVHMGVFAQ